MAEYGIVYTTTNSKENVGEIAAALLGQKLAACIQSIQMSSIYEWKGKIETDEEILMLIKIKKSDYSDVEKTIISTHIYETAEVILCDIEKGSPNYLSWISNVTR